MKMHIELTASEMSIINSILAVFEEQKAPVKQKLHEYSDMYEETISFNSDGSYSMSMEVKETLTIAIGSWLAQVCSQAKGLIMAAVDTYRNMVKMLGVKHLEIDGKEVNLDIPCRVSVEHNGYKIRATKYVPADSDLTNEKAKLKTDIIKKIDEPISNSTNNVAKIGDKNE